MNILLHLANGLLLLSFALKDILWLRFLNVMASVCFISFFYVRSEPMWAAIGWNLLFTSVNVYQIVALFLKRRPVYLTEEEQDLHHILFPTLTTREFAKLLRVGDWHVCEELEHVMIRDTPPDCVLLVSSGAMQVILHEEREISLERGQFAGEMSFLTGGSATADVIIHPNTRYLRWSKTHLQQFLLKHPNLYAAMQLAWSNDLVKKLRGN